MQAKKHLFTSVPLLLIGLGAIGFVCVGIYNEHNRTQKIDEEIARQQEIAAEISKENVLLKQTIDYLGSEEAQKFSAQEIGYKSEEQEVAQVRNLNEIEEALKLIEESEEDLDGQGSVAQGVPHWKQWWSVFF